MPPEISGANKNYYTFGCNYGGNFNLRFHLKYSHA